MIAEHIEGVTTSLDRLKELLGRIKSEQDYYRSRERRHRQSTLSLLYDDGVVTRLISLVDAALESNKSRVMWYTTLEIGVLAAMYGAQSFLLHKWFSDRGYVTKHQWGA